MIFIFIFLSEHLTNPPNRVRLMRPGLKNGKCNVQFKEWRDFKT